MSFVTEALISITQKKNMSLPTSDSFPPHDSFVKHMIYQGKLPTEVFFKQSKCFSSVMDTKYILMIFMWKKKSHAFVYTNVH